MELLQIFKFLYIWHWPCRSIKMWMTIPLMDITKNCAGSFNCWRSFNSNILVCHPDTTRLVYNYWKISKFKKRIFVFYFSSVHVPYLQYIRAFGERFQFKNNGKNLLNNLFFNSLHAVHGCICTERILSSRGQILNR